MTKSKDQLFVKIDNLLADLQSQYSELKANEQIDKVELALLVGQVDYLSAHLKALQHLESATAVNKTKEDNTLFTPVVNLTEAADEQEVYEEITELSANSTRTDSPAQTKYVAPKIENIDDISEPFEETSFDSNQTEVEEEVKEEALPEVEEELIINEVVEEPKEIVVEVPATAPIAEEPIAQAEEVPARPLTINELIQQQKKAGVNLTQQFQTNSSQERVADLKTAVNLNDKLLFIKDLFNGYSLAYSEALELLNRFNNFAEADAFLQSNYAIKNGWAEKPQSVEKFYAVLRKKFAN